MSAIRYASLWPGLPAAWYRGQARGLLLAVAFCWAMCLLLLVTFVWPAWISGWLVALMWAAGGVYWLFEVVRTQWRLDGLLENSSKNSTGEFIHAQREYLKGNWFEAEARLLEIVREHPHDVAAALMLVGVLRHTRRWRPALRRLEQLTLLDAAAGWQFEIYREQQLIERELAAEAADSTHRE